MGKSGDAEVCGAQRWSTSLPSLTTTKTRRDRDSPITALRRCLAKAARVLRVPLPRLNWVESGHELGGITRMWPLNQAASSRAE